MPRPRRSFFAYASAMLGLLSLMAVACFHFPELLTSKEFRAAYNEQFARHLLLVGLAAAFAMGTWAILRDRNAQQALGLFVLQMVNAGIRSGLNTEKAMMRAKGASHEE